MKLALVGDVHLVAEDDPHRQLHEKRRFFKDAWPSFVELLRRVEEEKPDQVVFLGDLVDWFSRENVTFALDLLSALQVPWVMTPGNHDVAIPDGAGEDDRHDRDPLGPARGFWAEQGCDWSPRMLEDDGVALLVFDSALSSVSPSDETWLKNSLSVHTTNLLATHVPADVPVIRDWIVAKAPGRDLRKYVQSGNPKLYDALLHRRVSHAFSGHLHLGGGLEYEGTRFHFLDMAISTLDTNRKVNHVAEFAVVETGGGVAQVKRIQVNQSVGRRGPSLQPGKK